MAAIETHWDTITCFFFHDLENCCVQYFTLHLYNFKYTTHTDVPFCDTQTVTHNKNIESRVISVQRYLHVHQ